MRRRGTRGCLGWIALAAALLAALPGCAPAEPSDPRALICFYVIAPGKAADLVLAAFEDGLLVWSEDPIAGGEPYRRARVDPALIHRAIERMHAAGALREIERTRYAGAGSSCSVLVVRAGERTICLESWHELFERHPNIAVTERGFSALDAGTRAEVLMNQSLAYRRFRTAWEDIKSHGLALIPADGEPALLPAARLERLRINAQRPAPFHKP